MNNLNTCSKLNPSYHINIWNDNDCNVLVETYKLSDIYISLSGIQRYNFVKYLIMHDQGGIYTDFDITWKRSFDFLMTLPNRYSGNEWPLNVQYNNNSEMYFPCYVKQDVILADDPFFITTPGKMLDCLTYCSNRTEYKHDIELYYKTGEMKIHVSEPYGPYGLTEWLQKNEIQFNMFFSEEVIEQHSLYANHTNGQSWR